MKLSTIFFSLISFSIAYLLAKYFWNAPEWASGCTAMISMDIAFVYYSIKEYIRQ